MNRISRTSIGCCYCDFIVSIRRISSNPEIIVARFRQFIRLCVKICGIRCRQRTRRVLSFIETDSRSLRFVHSLSNSTARLQIFICKLNGKPTPLQNMVAIVVGIFIVLISHIDWIIHVACGPFEFRCSKRTRDLLIQESLTFWNSDFLPTKITSCT